MPTSNPDPKDVQPHWWCPTCKKVSAYLVVDYDADPKVTEWRCSCGFARNCAVIAMDGKANQLLSGAIAELESSLASARAEIAGLEKQLHNWNRVMSTVLAGSEYHNNPQAYVDRFRQLGDQVKKLAIERIEARGKYQADSET